MKRIPISILLFVVVVSSASFATSQNANAAVPGKDIVLVVNADIVTMDRDC